MRFGASMILRQGIRALLQDARAGRFDLVLAEALDRVSRDQAARSVGSVSVPYVAPDTAVPPEALFTVFRYH